MNEGILATATVEFEGQLGDPLEAGQPLSWAQAMIRDENEAFPVDALEFLHRLGIPRFHVPVREGGGLDSFERLYALSRSVSRRDPAVALTAGMQIWSQLIWIAGSPAQKTLMRERLLANCYPYLAVSEEMHGADLLASEVTAHETPQGVELNGEKWPIGLGARWDLALVLARTNGEAGYRRLSWYLVDKGQMRAGCWSPLPKLRTLGVRAAELAGLSLRGVLLRPDARIGKVGDGLELVLRLFQITRILACGFAMGPADTALRIAVSFAGQRKLHGKKMSEIPQVRETLVAAYLDLLAAEALMISSLRGMHFRPDELSVVSLIVKVLVPELTERVIRSASEALGARYYLREGFAEGVFQKMVRDQAAIGLFDGSTPVCISGLIPQLAKLLEKLREADPANGMRCLEARFSLGRDVPDFEVDRLELVARGSDEVLQATRDHPVLRDRVAALIAKLPTLSMRSPLAFAAAREYCILHSAAACIHVGPRLASAPAGWVDGVLARLLYPTSSLSEHLSESLMQSLFARLLFDVTVPRALSLLATPLPDSPIELRGNGQ